MTARSLLAGRMVAAARRAFRSWPLHTITTTTTTDAATAIATKEQHKVVSRLDVMEDISFPYMTREMAAVLRRSRVAAVEHNNFNIRQLANPYHGPADGDILYDRAWINNLALLFTLSTLFGAFSTLAKLKQTRTVDQCVQTQTS
ncbi:uncharacterized protein [Oryza sativa Japonica Group]|jgi:hypothetical protein|uniref:Os07g0110900 protein n=5 Tax=Oryza TaxID=4527 RepID=Q8H5U8_ORYSJ|nr:uncharacterized protein LOC4342230 [Oryza sativa Japonica Group]KAB8104087.1 hypothetical protein EE612_036740 [Oryza sativa]KAF2921147.1 hypothetical protein DAI22_07g008300 [Oryza sativa Japonica Group]BAC15842.1 unknown protein [Oryza sativa Japonica Group]BAF20649.1 Os07g0110900 [Oryza sativa Japonica Group]BAG86861.1 unnamed protein product [Oryza sativa Japonica Group]|eukprot:NP_001058735.1 Os07g0110900 [Oryza sativa Japonica Group]